MAIPAVVAAAARAVVSAAAKAAAKVAKKAVAKKTAEKVTKTATEKAIDKTAKTATRKAVKKAIETKASKKTIEKSLTPAKLKENKLINKGIKATTSATIKALERAGIVNTPQAVRTVRENQFLLEESYTYSVTRDIWSGSPLKYRGDAIINAFKGKQLKDGSPIQTVQDVTEYLRENDPNFPKTRNVNVFNVDIVQGEIEEREDQGSPPREFVNKSVDWGNVAQFNQRANKVWAGFQQAMNNAGA